MTKLYYLLKYKNEITVVTQTVSSFDFFLHSNSLAKF